jgi:NAD(P)-dependent dehydrogenase (short-subunit alcohol dehydrogenase family)
VTSAERDHDATTGSRLDGLVAVVTGGASGVGAAMARLFVGEGARVVVADLDEDRARSVADALGDGNAALPVRADVGDEADVEAAIAIAVERFGGLDCMINNAGVYGWDGPIDDTPADAFDDAVRVILRGAFLGTKHAARAMRRQRSGRIISTASVAGLAGGLGPHAYSAAKAGVIGLTRSVAAELRHVGITVNAIVPGGVITPMLAEVALGDRAAVDRIEAKLDSRPSLDRPALPEEIANAALWLAGPHAAHVTGHTLVVDGGISSAWGRETAPTRPEP